ncbi:hypothetical protein HMSSN036_96910 [Paenibacillus macerans]|nr:hypothetical protein HMSSN036_96910 [Paenibacillus macerans]
MTFPYFLGLEASRAEVEKLTAAAKAAIGSGIVPHPERLLDIADVLVRRDH